MIRFNKGEECDKVNKREGRKWEGCGSVIRQYSRGP